MLLQEVPYHSVWLAVRIPACKRRILFTTIEKDFKDPPADFRSAPLAVWNSKVTEAEVERTMRELKEAGFGGLFHSSPSGYDH